MLTVLTILAVSITDLLGLLRSRYHVTTVRYVQLGWWALLILLAALWVRPDSWTGAVAALIAAGWYFIDEKLSPQHRAAAPAGPDLYAWSPIGLVTIIAGFAWLDLTLLDTAVPAGLLWLALAAFLTQSGNRITRAVLLLSGREITADGATPGSVPASGLKGGRVIGPLERIFITVLIVVGAYHIVAALMAAKGIVRFPEISADAKRVDDAAAGTKAEEFLVGSLASWGLAGGAGLLAYLLL